MQPSDAKLKPCPFCGGPHDPFYRVRKDAYDELEASAAAAEAKVKELTAENERLLSMLKRVPAAMSGYFVGGIEEREGGSARRQEKLMKDGDALLDEIRTAFKEAHNGE